MQNISPKMEIEDKFVLHKRHVLRPQDMQRIFLRSSCIDSFIVALQVINLFYLPIFSILYNCICIKTMPILSYNICR